MVELVTKEDFDLSCTSINSKKKVGFKIVDVEAAAIPTVLAKNHPVQRDPKDPEPPPRIAT